MSHPSFARRTLVLIALSLAALCPTRAAVVTWTNTAGGNWNSTNNWSPNTVPASGDTVFITNAGTYTVTVDVGPTLASLTVGNTNGGTLTVNLASATLTLNGASFFQTNTVFNFSGGALDGTGEVIFAGAFNWSAGTMTGTGKTTWTNVASVTLSTTTKALTTRAIDHYTTNCVWTAGTLNAGFGPLWVIKPGAVLDLQGDVAVAYAYGGGFLTFNNGGTIKKSGGLGTANLQAVINNGGLVSALSGVLSLDGGGASSGCMFNAGSGAVLNFGGGGVTQTLVASCGFTGAGLHRISGVSPTLYFASPATITPSFELGSGGTLDGTNEVIFAGPFTWSAGTMTGAGKTTWTNTASVSLTTTTKALTARTIDHYTTNCVWTGGNLNAGFGPLWVIKAGAVLDIQADVPVVYAYGGSFLTFNNGGTLKKSGGLGVANLAAVVNNGGLVSGLSGVLSLDGGGASSGCTFNAGSGAVLNFGGNGVTQTLLASCGFTGAGLHRISGISPVVNFAVPITITPSFELGSGGILDGTNEVIFAGPFIWSAGTMTGAGKTTWTNTASVSLTTTTKALTTRTIDHYTTNCVWTGGNLNAGFGPLWVIKAGAVLDIQADVPVVYSFGGNFLTFNNGGTLKKSGGGGTANLAAVVNNGGLVSALSGVLSLDGGGASSGCTFNAGSGAVLNFGGNGVTQTLLASCGFTGAGLHRISGISPVVNFAVPITITPSFELGSGGILDGTNEVIFAGPFIWSAGTMTGAGKTTWTNGASVTISTTTKALTYRTIDHYTTNAVWPGGTINAGFGPLWTIKPGAVLDLQADVGVAYAFGGNFLTFNNGGTLKKSGGLGTANLAAVVNNGGLVSALSGVLSLDGGGASSGCTFNAGSGGVLNFGGNGVTQTLLASCGFTGAGLHRISGISPTVYFAAPNTITPSFELGNGGILDGTNEVIFAGPFNWSAGTMTGAGKTTWTNTASVTLTTTTKALTTRTIDHYTTNAIWTGGTLNAGFGPLWTIKPGAALDLQADVAVAYAFGGNSLTLYNNGTLKKSAGAGNSSFLCAVTNAGTVRSQSGTLDWPSSYTQIAGQTELAGGSLSGALLDVQGGLLTGSGNIAANVRNAAQVAPGSGVGLMTLLSPQTYTSTTNSLLTFQIGGTTPVSGHDQLRLNNGTATLAGTLRVELANAYVPTAGNAYTVMTFTARSGQFTNFSFPDYDFNVLQTATNIILIASNAPPAVSLVGPSNQLVCAQFQLQTSASDLDGAITNLSLLINSNTIASFTNGTSRKVLVSYDYPGSATLTARATDNTGAVRETNITTLFYTLPLHVLNVGGKLTNGQFKFCMLGQNGKNYDVLVNTNLNFPSNWTAIGVMENTNGVWRFTDPAGTNFGPRYYRARQQ